MLQMVAQGLVPCLARLRLLLVLAVVGIPNVWAIAGSNQLWPYDSGPMFAVTIDDDVRLHRFNFIYEPGEEKLDYKGYRVNERSFSRHFFAHVYGSMDPLFPDRHMPDDTPEQFTERMTSFFSELHKRKKHPKGSTALRIEVVRLAADHSTVEEMHVVGRYDLKRKKFVHTWRQP